MTRRKPRDVGNGLLAASFTESAILAVTRPHPWAGMVELTADLLFTAEALQKNGIGLHLEVGNFDGKLPTRV